MDAITASRSAAFLTIAVSDNPVLSNRVGRSPSLSAFSRVFKYSDSGIALYSTFTPSNLDSKSSTTSFIAASLAPSPFDINQRLMVAGLSVSSAFFILYECATINAVTASTMPAINSPDTLRVLRRFFSLSNDNTFFSPFSAIKNSETFLKRICFSTAIAFIIVLLKSSDTLGLIAFTGNTVSLMRRFVASSGFCPVSIIYIVAPSA